MENWVAIENWVPEKERAPAEVPSGTENRDAIIDYHHRSSDTALYLRRLAVENAAAERGYTNASWQDAPFVVLDFSEPAAKLVPSANPLFLETTCQDTEGSGDSSRSNQNVADPVASPRRSRNHASRSFPTGRERVSSSRHVSNRRRSRSLPTLPKAGQPDMVKIRDNMNHLIEPKVMQDWGYGHMMYDSLDSQQSFELAQKRLRRHYRREARKDKKLRQVKDNGGPYSNIFWYMQQQGASVAYAERQGEYDPSTASFIECNHPGGIGVQIIDDLEFNAANWDKFIKECHEDYDDAYEQNLHEMGHGVDCVCNRHGFPADPPEPTWTVDASVRPKPRTGPADPMTDHGRQTWEAAHDLYDREISDL